MPGPVISEPDQVLEVCLVLLLLIIYACFLLSTPELLGVSFLLVFKLARRTRNDCGLFFLEWLELTQIVGTLVNLAVTVTQYYHRCQN